MDLTHLFIITSQSSMLLITSLILCIFTTIIYIINNSLLMLISTIVLSCIAISSLALGLLWLAYYDKTKTTKFKICCCNMFNVIMMILFASLVIIFFFVFASIIYANVTDTTTQYIIYSIFGFIALTIIIMSVIIAFQKRKYYNNLN